MRVHVISDMEGVAGIVKWEQTTGGEALYEEGRKLYTEEINAAVRGAKAAGATEILVMDCHGAGKGWTFNSLIAEDLDPACEFVVQDEWTEYTEFLEAGCDAALFVGMHARAGAGDGVMNHTISGRDFQNLWFNGTLVGETGINAALCGTWGCPVLLVTGDDASCREGTELLGDGLTTVSVKRGFSSFSARNLTPARARELIEEGAKAALSDLSAVRAVRPRQPVRDQGRVQAHGRRAHASLPAGRRDPRAAHHRLPRRHLVGRLDAVLFLSRRPRTGSRSSTTARSRSPRTGAGSRFAATSSAPASTSCSSTPGFPDAYYEDAEEAGRRDGLDAFGRLVSIGPRIGPRRSSHSSVSSPSDVTELVLTHGDIDHVGGMHDFPDATLVCRSAERRAGPPRYYGDSARSTGPRVRDTRLVDGDEEIAPGVTLPRDAGSLARPPLAAGRSWPRPARDPRLRRDLARGTSSRPA